MNVRLIKPTAELQEEYLSFYLDWKESNEPIVPWVVSKDPADFAGMIRFLEDNEQGKDLPDGYVRNSTLWLVTETNRIVGAVNIRHELNEKLLESSGHIGYGIRPSERQKATPPNCSPYPFKKPRSLEYIKCWWSAMPII